MEREPVTVEAPPARLRFRVLADGKPVKGALVEFRLLDPFFDVPEEVRREVERVKMVPVKTPTARLRFKVKAKGEPAQGAVATFKLLEPYFDVPEKLKKIMGVSKEHPWVVWGERRVGVGKDGYIDVRLPLGLYGVIISKPGYRDTLFAVTLGGDMELLPIRLKKGKGKPVHLGIFLYTEVVVKERGEEGD